MININRISVVILKNIKRLLVLSLTFQQYHLDIQMTCLTKSTADGFKSSVSVKKRVPQCL